MRYDAAIFDVDGVLTQTAALHQRSWKEALDELLATRADQPPFSAEDYRAHVDGKPRDHGLRDFLRARGLELPERELEALAERKNERFHRLLGRGVQAFDDGVRAVRAWRRHGMPVAFVSSSKNARYVLEAAGIDDLPDLVIDGRTAAERGLAGKPDLFREAARRLHTEPAKAIVVEDAVAGVEAAAEIGFALVIGVARNEDARAALEEHGADRVVATLDEVDDVIEPGSRPPASLPSALLFEVIEDHLEGKRPVVLLDFDGTLAPFADRPEDAGISEPTREVLRELAARCTVAIVCGRDRQDAARRVGVEGLWYVGSHGFEIAAPDGRTFQREDALPATREIDRLEHPLRRELGDLPGVVFERKAFELAVHYRLASERDGERVARRVRELARATRHLCVRTGDQVIAICPELDWNKGRAIVDVLARLEVRSEVHLPIYIGDGRADEDAFRALADGGLGILVGRPARPTHADLRLDSPEQVTSLLRKLVRWLDGVDTREGWLFGYDTWDPVHEVLREALCTVGNGNLATRGAAEEASADGVHYPGTYLAGGYDRIATEIMGEVLVNEDLVNWPNWLRLSFRPAAGGEWLSLARFTVHEFAQSLDLRRGILQRSLIVRDREGRETRLVSRRFVSMDDPNVAALRWELTPLNWSGRLEVRSTLDGTVRNRGVLRYGELRGHHLAPGCVGTLGEDGIWLAMRTQQSNLHMAQVARTLASIAGNPIATDRRTTEYADRVDQYLTLEAIEGETVTIDKLVAIHSSRDPAIASPVDDAKARARVLPSFEVLQAAHARRWAQLWRRCDIQLGPGHLDDHRILRLHIFHLLQVASPHIIRRDVGVPARGLHGEAYRGHIFWDELFILPFLTLRLPKVTRELLMYRYQRLDLARGLARDLGCTGAAYPWQSGTNGREESQLLHLNPRSGRWVADDTLLQRHISSAIAWNVWTYFEATHDQELFASYGAEMMLEIARFWASLATWDEARGRYRIRGVVGPDEFHTRYPGADQPGLDDNAYTNVMAAWCLRGVERVLAELHEDRRCELLEELEITERDRRYFEEVARKLYVPFLDDRIISQFEGYGALAEFDWAGYRRRYGDIQRLDRILEAEGDTVNRYKASKQADVLMLFFLFRDDELVELLGSMGYAFDPAWIKENVDYYLARTSHGSTLSRLLHAWVLARHDRVRAYVLFREALQSDVDDIQGGTTPEGIHLGAMAGTVDLVQRCFAGVSIRDGVMWITPRMPAELTELGLRLRVRDAWIELSVTHDHVELELVSDGPYPVRVGVAGELHALVRGRRQRFAIDDRA